MVPGYLHYGLVRRRLISFSLLRGLSVPRGLCGFGLAVVVGLVGAGCSDSAAKPSSTDQAYLAEVHGAAADINQYRSDTQLIRLGHVVCDDFRAKASYQEVADRLSVAAGAKSLPSADLGAVITAAGDTYCPQYRGDV